MFYNFNRGFGRNIISLAQNLGYQLLPIMLLITEPGLVINKKSLNCISISSTLLFLCIFLLLHFSWNFNISYKVHFLTLAFNSQTDKSSAEKKGYYSSIIKTLEETQNKKVMQKLQRKSRKMFQHILRGGKFSFQVPDFSGVEEKVCTQKKQVLKKKPQTHFRQRYNQKHWFLLFII